MTVTLALALMAEPAVAGRRSRKAAEPCVWDDGEPHILSARGTKVYVDEEVVRLKKDAELKPLLEKLEACGFDKDERKAVEMLPASRAAVGVLIGLAPITAGVTLIIVPIGVKFNQDERDAIAGDFGRSVPVYAGRKEMHKLRKATGGKTAVTSAEATAQLEKLAASKHGRAMTHWILSRSYEEQGDLERARATAAKGEELVRVKGEGVLEAEVARIDRAIDARDWSVAQKIDTIASYEQYLEAHPHGAFGLLADQARYALVRAAALAEARDDPAALHAFCLAYSDDSEERRVAEQRLFEGAREAESWKGYLEHVAERRHATNVGYERRAWFELFLATVNPHDPDQLLAFLAEHPEATNRREVWGLHFQVVASGQSEEQLVAFTQSHPDSPFVREAWWEVHERFYEAQGHAGNVAFLEQYPRAPVASTVRSSVERAHREVVRCAVGTAVKLGCNEMVASSVEAQVASADDGWDYAGALLTKLGGDWLCDEVAGFIQGDYQVPRSVQQGAKGVTAAEYLHTFLGPDGTAFGVTYETRDAAIEAAGVTIPLAELAYCVDSKLR